MRQNIYDNKNFSQEYDKMRFESKGCNANDLIEIPNFRTLMPPVAGKTILDLGCGYGENARYFIKQGAKSVTGIDISRHMIEIAKRENNISGVEFKMMAMEDISKLECKYDIVVSSLAFHYVQDYEKLISDVYGLLNDGGCLCFSQEHPIATATIQGVDGPNTKITINDKWYFLLSDYNKMGQRNVIWNGENVQKYHRNMSEILNTLIEHSFKIDKILEPSASDEAISKMPKYIHQSDRPYFLFVRAYKNN